MKEIGTLKEESPLKYSNGLFLHMTGSTIYKNALN